MEHKHRRIDWKEMVDVLPELLRSGAEFPLVISGNSMYPFLKEGRDTVYLSKVQDQIDIGDVILYCRCAQVPVLHRVIAVRDDGFVLLGDRQTGCETGVKPESVLAVASAVRRKGRLIGRNHPIWFFFARIWPKLIRFRPKLIRIYAFVNGDKGI